jgi:tRNA(Ile2) C34 agmatinyltransferase TiaS
MTDHPSSEPWRLACPRGHRSIRMSGRSTYRCGACREVYDAAEITDVKTGQVMA